jgi:hypothetical protein
MVAGSSSCSCPVCGVTCTGRFGACSTVWAAGAQQVTLRPSRPALVANRQMALPAAPVAGAANGSNGNGTRHPDPEPVAEIRAETRVENGVENGAEIGVENGAESAAGPEVPAEAIATLLYEIRILQAQVDQVHAATLGEREDETIRMAQLILSEFHVLPTRIADALSAALQEQHRVIMSDIRKALQDAIAEIKSQH